MKKYNTYAKKLYHKAKSKVKRVFKMKKEIFKFIIKLLEILKLVLDLMEKISNFFH